MKNYILKTVAFIFLMVLATPLFAQSPFSVEWDKEPLKLSVGSEFTLNVSISAPEGFYLYASSTDVEFRSLEGIIISKIKYPTPTDHFDPQAKRNVKVYEGGAGIKISGHVPEGLKNGKCTLVAIVRFKGCSQTSCTRPEEREIAFTIDVQGAHGAAAKPDTKAEKTLKVADLKTEISAVGDQAVARIFEKGLLSTLLLVLLAGILTSLTPCVWPVIPAVMVFIGVHPHRHFGKNLISAMSLCLGLILIYSLFGILAVAMGKNLGFLFQSPVFSVLVVLFFLAMSFSMFGLFELRLPHKWHHLASKLGGKGYLGAFFAGMGLGLIASPCSGPVVAAILTYVAVERSFFEGFLVLSAYALGLSMVLCVIGAGYGFLAGKMRGGKHLVWAKRFLGVLLLIPAIFYAQSLLNLKGCETSGPKVEWIQVEADAMKFAKSDNRPLMIDFTADWCPPCKALDERVFSQEDVIKLSYQLVPLKIDATRETKEVREILDKYKVFGMPAVIFVSPDGEVYEDLRLKKNDHDSIRDSMAAAIERAKNKK